jgi:hypothetical protein
VLPEPGICRGYLNSVKQDHGRQVDPDEENDDGRDGAVDAEAGKVSNVEGKTLKSELP